MNHPPTMVADAKDPQAILGHVIRCTSTAEIWSTLHECSYAIKENSFNFGYNKGNGNYRGQPHGSRGEGGGRNQSKNKLICQVYRKPRHIALKCYHRFDLSYQGQEVAANANSTNTSSTTYTNPQAYMAAPSSSDPNNNSWFLDSGAKHLIIVDSSNLASKDDYNDKKKLVIGTTLLKGVYDRGLYHLKLSPTRTTQASTKCLSLGYSPTHKGYRFLSLSDRIYVAKSVTFNENDFPYSTLFTQPNTPHQSFIHKFSCPSYVLPYCPLVSPPSTHFPTSSSQCHISYFVNMSNTFIATVTDTPMALTLPVSNALSNNACSSFSNSIIGSVSLPSCHATSTTVPIVDNIVSTPCTHVV
ncbi:hypothetical protein CK203_045650 [Vitis vinifera]|uniref:Retroviral polymerase SH3-like domain-containing protein n=1 Tax=Vitis vinifera TaxID=29760 RepID=A0A438HQ74_VITVI|nr:hypothetical protein CK203_045650 [Vitis vinifera]